MFALGLSYAQLLVRLVVERWKVVEVWPSFSRDAKEPLDGLRFRHCRRRRNKWADGRDQLRKNGA